MNWIKHPLELRHLGVLSGASETISEPTVCLAQSCTYLEPTLALSPNGPKWDFTRPTSPWSSIGCIQNDFWACGTFGANRATILHQVWHYLQSNWIGLLLEPWHLGVPSGVSKIISVPTVCLAQTMHLSLTDTNTVFKWTKTRFHMTYVTLEFYRVRPKRFLRLWYIQHKPWTYLASRLALSSNRLNRASTWALSPRSTIVCVQNDFWGYGTFGTNRAPILRQD
jgi:hypothetical protein